MKKIIPFIFILAAISLSSGCGLFSGKEDKIINIDKDLELVLDQNIFEQQHPFQLKFFTVVEDHCPDAVIEYSIKTTANSFDIKLLEISDPNTCGAMDYPGIATLEFNNLEQRNYSFSLDLFGAVINKGILTVDADTYTITMQNQFGLSLGETELRKIPNQIIWGYLGSDDSGTDLKSLGDQIKSLGKSKNFIDGYYGAFSLKSGNLSFSSQDSYPAYLNYFIFDHQNQVEQIKELISDARSDFPDLVIKAITAEGQIL